MKVQQGVHFGKMIANENRLKILKILWGNSPKNVTNLSRQLKISLNATSRHLNLLEHQRLVKGSGRYNHVYYAIAPDMPNEFKSLLIVLLKQLS